MTQAEKLSNNCQSKQDGICLLPLNSCVQCSVNSTAMKFSEWCNGKVELEPFKDSRNTYEVLSYKTREWLDAMVERYIGELLLNQVIRERKVKKPQYKKSNFPTDTETGRWYDENIDSNCSASSAIYKFRLWLRDRNKN